MSEMRKKVVLMSVVAVLCAGMMVLFAGCKENDSGASPNADVDAPSCGAGCAKACCADKEAKACGEDCTKACCADKEAKTCEPGCTKPCCADKEAVEEVIESTTTTVEQTTCPVMGGPVNKAVFTEYEGKKVYFCCPGCDEKFKADPEKYLSKLPQFAK